MIGSLSLILLCQLTGEIAVRGFSLPVPGPVVGLLLLLLLLLGRDRILVLARGPRLRAVEATGNALLSHLSLLFVPAGVGLIQKIDVIADHGVAIAVVLALSVMLTLLATVAAFLLVTRLTGRQ
jgi:holin-like protein